MTRNVCALPDYGGVHIFPLLYDDLRIHYNSFSSLEKFGLTVIIRSVKPGKLWHPKVLPRLQKAKQERL